MDTISYRTAVAHLADRLREAYNGHDADAIADLFGPGATVHDQAFQETYPGRDAIRAHYAAEFRSAPDIRLDEERRYLADDAVAIESTIRGTHGGDWRGMPATGNTFEVRVWSALRADSTGERIVDLRYDYDRARLLTQIGMLHDLDTTLGKTVAVLTHPVTMARAARKRLSSRPPSVTS